MDASAKVSVGAIQKWLKKAAASLPLNWPLPDELGFCVKVKETDFPKVF